MLVHLFYLVLGLVIGFVLQFVICLATGYHIGMLFGVPRWKFLGRWNLR